MINLNLNQLIFIMKQMFKFVNLVNIYYLNNYEIPKIINKKQGIFEKFFNFFSK